MSLRIGIAGIGKELAINYLSTRYQGQVLLPSNQKTFNRMVKNSKSELLITPIKTSQQHFMCFDNDFQLVKINPFTYYYDSGTPNLFNYCVNFKSNDKDFRRELDILMEIIDENNISQCGIDCSCKTFRQDEKMYFL